MSLIAARNACELAPEVVFGAEARDLLEITGEIIKQLNEIDEAERDFQCKRGAQSNT